MMANIPRPAEAISRRMVTKIKKLLQDHPRDFALFTVGVNSGLRAGELLSLRVNQVRGLEPGDSIQVKMPKVDRYRTVRLNKSAMDAIEGLLATRSWEDRSYLYLGRESNGDKPITVNYLSKLVKKWCSQVGLNGNRSSHCLRKTYGAALYEKTKDIGLVCEALSHARVDVTLRYLGITQQHVNDAVDSLNL